MLLHEEEFTHAKGISFNIQSKEGGTWKRKERTEQAQLTFKNLPKSAGIEGGTLWGQKNFFWSKVIFLG